MAPKKSSTKPAKTPAAAKTERLRKAALAEVKAKREALEASDAAPAALEHQEPSEKERHNNAVTPPSGDAAPDATAPATPEAAPQTAKKGRKPKAEKAPKPTKPKKVSGLDAAAMVLAGAKEPMSAKEIIAEVFTRKLWSSKGETPEATLYAAMIREIAAKGATARFVKAERGRFTAAKS